MAVTAFTLAKRIIHRLALDDIRVSIAVVGCTARLLHVAARTPAERRRTARLVILIEKARATIERL